MPVAVLCVRADSVYKKMRGVVAYDCERDARTFAGGMPVVAHPPCAQWGRLRKFANDRPDEKALAPLCVAHVRRWGGVLEHPASSLLWGASGLPKPGEPADEFGGATIELPQFWFGHRAAKLTWLYIVRCRVPQIQLPLGEPSRVVSTRQRGPERKPEISKAERERTPEQFARWMVRVARTSSELQCA